MITSQSDSQEPGDRELPTTLSYVADEDIDGADGDVMVAMEMWVRKRGPVTIQRFQAVYWALCRRPDYEDYDTPDGEVIVERHRRVRDQYELIQSAIYGEKTPCRSKPP